MALAEEETNTVLEINANPHRLDLNAEIVRKYPNVKLTINADASYKSFRFYELWRSNCAKRICNKR